MKKLEIRDNQRFGRWIAVRESEPILDACGIRQRRFLCRCDCGNEKIIRLGTLRKKDGTKSCGCYRRDRVRKHGHSTRSQTSPTYVVWAGMVQRCTNPLNPTYRYYGGRGIGVCERWRKSFENFLADMGERPKGTTIDRIDVDGNYEPGNCRWVAWQVQHNNKRDTVRIWFAGEYMSRAQFCRLLHLNYDSFRHHYNTLKKPLEEILLGGLCARR